MATSKREKIGEDGLSVRARNCVRNTIYGDIDEWQSRDSYAPLTRREAIKASKFGKDEFERSGNCGVKTVKLIAKWLKHYNLSFKAVRLEDRVACLEKSLKNYANYYLETRRDIKELIQIFNGINFHEIMSGSFSDATDRNKYREYLMNCVDAAQKIVSRIDNEIKWN